MSRVVVLGESALWLCAGEKSQIQALDRTAPIVSLLPGLPERQIHDPQLPIPRNDHSICRILYWNGKVIGSCSSLLRGKEFARVLNQIDPPWHPPQR
jgi:hypothetical protein